MDAISQSARDYMGLAGKVCAITGAGSGIGRATALAMARLGADVVLIGRTPASLEQTAGQASAFGARALPLRCDTGNAGDIRSAAQATEEQLGGCDILVNAAGILRAGSLADLPLEEWNAAVNVNLTGYFLCAQAFGRQMRAKGKGSIVHVASITATYATPHSGAYAVTKAGITLLSRQLALEWAPDGVRSNTVCPGMTWTGMTEASYSRPGESEVRGKAIPLGRIGEAEEMADAIVFLASDRSAYTTGADLTVDGGFTRNLLGLTPRTAR